MVRAKVCGLTRAEDVALAVDAGADAVGVVVDVPVDSPRAVSADRAAELFAGAPPFVTTVLVTMPETAERARRLYETTTPDVVQVHGTLSPEAVADLRASIPASVLVAVGLEDPIREYATVADGVVVDSTDESGAGGTGRTHDWERTRDLRDALDVPLVLAGGLTPGNVADAVVTVDPFAVDVSSGVEARGGVKNPEAVRAFVQRATSRRAEA